MTRQLELDMELWRLAARAIDLGLKEMFLSITEEELQDKLQADDNGRLLLGDFARFLEHFGARTVIPKELSDQTWQENPAPVLGTLRAYVAQGGNYDFDRIIKETAAERDRVIELTARQN